jgi:hypothetical protein
MLRYTLLFAMIVLAGCRTITNPFVHMAPDFSDVPAQALEAVAADIEAAVRAGDRTFTISDQGGIVVSDERVVQAIRTRIARAELIDEFLDSGFAWERTNGLLEVIRNREYKRARTRRQKDRDALLIMSENADRWAIYEGILKASKLSPRALSAIQLSFHTARIPLLAPGQLYEDNAGQRVAKGL